MEIETPQFEVLGGVYPGSTANLSSYLKGHTLPKIRQNVKIRQG